jgi:hypothetical protein
MASHVWMFSVVLIFLKGLVGHGTLTFGLGRASRFGRVYIVYYR